MKRIINFICNIFKKKKPEFDRNYHHYIITEHCRDRMKQRHILYKDVSNAFRYGKHFDNQVILDICDFPKDFFTTLKTSEKKHILNLLPLVITIKPETNIITTVYKGNNSIRSQKDISLYNSVWNKLHRGKR